MLGEYIYLLEHQHAVDSVDGTNGSQIEQTDQRCSGRSERIADAAGG